MKPLDQLLRPNIAALSPYSSARNEYSGHTAHVFLDANENPYNGPFNRYPDPLQHELKARISQVKHIPEPYIFLGNGSDEPIDLMYRCFCRPGTDNVVAIEPTYGMYQVCADVNDTEYRRVRLSDTFRLNPDELLAACDANTKIVWICSPNNPTGNSFPTEDLLKVVEQFEGLVVIDEAYIDFSHQPSVSRLIASRSNLVVLQTMSKAWGCAAIRLGMAFASPAIIEVFNKVKYPYNVNLLTQQQALKSLADPSQTEKWVRIILQERTRMIEAFRLLPTCTTVYPTDANFFLARMTDANAIYHYLVEQGIIVRNRTNVTLCNNCLRITIGSRTENTELLSALRQYS